MIPLRKTFWRTEQFIMRRILHADDTPHRLALGIALGMFVAWTPTVGLQMLIVLTLAALVGANRIVGLPIVWISNPFTVAPLYFFNYRLGRFLLAIFSERPEMDYQKIESLLASSSLGSFYEAEFWHNLINILWAISVDLWVGSIIVGLFLGAITYAISYRIIIWYRTHTPRGRRHTVRMKRRLWRKSRT